MTQILGGPRGGPLGRGTGVATGLAATGIILGTGAGRAAPAFNRGLGLNLFGFGGGCGSGFVGASGGGLFNPGLAAEKENLLSMFEYNYLNGTFGPEDVEILDVIQAEDQTVTMTEVASLGSFSAGCSNAILCGVGLPTPFLCYAAQPTYYYYPIQYTEAQVVVPVGAAASPTVTYVEQPGVTNVNQPVANDGAPQVVTANHADTVGQTVDLNTQTEQVDTQLQQATFVANTSSASQDPSRTGSALDTNSADGASSVQTDPAQGSQEPENRIVLTSPADAGGPVSYDLSGYLYTIDPGNEQTLTTRPSWIVTFDRGGGFGQAAYTVTNGTYAFQATEKGWDLIQVNYEISLDNSKNETDFNYLRNGQAETVRAGQTLTISHTFPHEVLFDRGDGGEPGKRVLERGLYSIGIDKQTGLFDITAADKPTGTTSGPAPTTAATP